MAKKDNYQLALLEDISGHVKAILEILVPMREEVAIIKEDATLIKDDIAVLKAAAKKTNQNVAEHGHRLTQLEIKTAL
jgi:hypothetical protein